MGFFELLLIAVGLSADAFAVAVCTGLTLEKFRLKKALITGLYFGIFQAAMPLIGYLVGHFFADMIVAFDHWVAFFLLALIGGKMIKESYANPECCSDVCQIPTSSSPEGEGATREGNILYITQEASLGPARMIPLAIATSIDALAVGVTFSFLSVKIVPAISFIGVTTLVLSMVGVKVGYTFGSRYKSKAEQIGGLILILIGLKILLEHLGIIGF
ncbi:MAG: manganese efflux pump MntP family protein [Oscillospiraceae bacterium]|jgi:putative Mn2+ efflux pump MntP